VRRFEIRIQLARQTLGKCIRSDAVGVGAHIGQRRFHQRASRGWDICRQPHSGGGLRNDRWLNPGLKETDMANNTNASRRSFLSGAAMLAGAAATQVLVVAKEAQAQQKVPQAAVKYQDNPKGDQRCDGCLQFVAPNACKVVDGTISASGWCAIWVKKA
jgi:hypothetical protein